MVDEAGLCVQVPQYKQLRAFKMVWGGSHCLKLMSI